jgi:hypothetical protein
MVLRSDRLATCSSLVSELCERTSALSVLSDPTQRGVSVKLQWLAFKTAREKDELALQKGLGKQAGTHRTRSRATRRRSRLRLG